MDFSIKNNQFVLTIKEAAEYLRLSPRTVQRLASQGALPGVKMGRQWRFSKDCIAELLRHPKILRHADLKKV